MIDKTKLRVLAESATHKEYAATSQSIGNDYVSVTAGKVVICTVHNAVDIANILFGNPMVGMWANAHFIAAANPKSILALLDELQAQNDAIDRLQCHVKAGASIQCQEGLYCLFDARGEGIASGITLRSMLMDLISGD